MNRRMIASFTLAISIVALSGSSASAHCEDSSSKGCSTEVKAVTVDPATPVTPKAQAPAASGQLPVTGGNAGTIAVAGAALLATGVAFVGHSRNSKDPAEA